MRTIVKSKLFKSTFWSAGGNGLMAAISFVTSIFVVRNLGPSEYGVLQEMMACLLIIQNFESLVNPNIYKKMLIEDPENTQNLIFTFGAIISIFGIISTLVAAALYFFFNLNPKYALLIILLAGVTFRFSNAIVFYLDAKFESFKSQLTLNFGNTLACIYKYGASIVNPVALWQCIAVPIQYAGTLALCVVYYRKDFPGPHKYRFQYRKFLSVIIATFPLFLAGLVDLLRGRFPFLYLGEVVSSTEVGLFGAGVKLTEPWLFLASALTISFWPKLVSSKIESKQKYDDAIHLFFAANFFIFMSIGLGGYFFSDFFINTLLGGKYAGSLVIFQIQALTLLPQALGVALTIIETNEGLVRISFGRNFISLIICVVSIYFLVPAVGIRGASLAVMLSNLVPNLIFPLLFKQSRWIIWRVVLAPILGPKVILRHLQNKN